MSVETCQFLAMQSGIAEHLNNHEIPLDSDWWAYVIEFGRNPFLLDIRCTPPTFFWFR
jgi:hypothetical protein